MSLKLNSSGGGSVTLQEPVTASDLTLNLPATLGNTGNSMVVTSDASGNLGLGVTPSAWGSAVKAIENQGGALYASSTSFIVLGQNFYNNGTNFIYKNSNPATAYSQNSGIHQWFTAPSGTAGNAFSFTQAMTLSLGNLQVNAASAGSDLGAISFGFDGGSNVARISAVRIGNNSTNALVFSTDNGGSFAERARIDSSGNLLVGKTATGTTTQGVQLAPAGGTSVFTRNGGAGCIFVGNSNQNVVEFNYSSTTVGSISIGPSSTAFNTSSDYRLKNTIAPMTGALAKVALLKPCTYKWNADGSDGQGFIAHELAEVVPDAVTGKKDAVDSEGKPVYQGIDTSFLVATLTAAIQELKAELDTVKSELAAMKGTI